MGGRTLERRFLRGGGFHSDPASNIRNSSVRHVSGESPCEGKRRGREEEGEKGQHGTKRMRENEINMYRSRVGQRVTCTCIIMYMCIHTYFTQ